MIATRNVAGWCNNKHILFNLDILVLQCQDSSLIRLRQYAEKFLFYLTNLKSEYKFKTYLISNAHPSMLEFKMRLIGLECFFDHIDSSHSYGVIHETPDFWLKYIENFKINKSEAILFDNNYKAIKSAKAVGLDIIHINDLNDELIDNISPEIKQISSFSELLPLKFVG